MRTEFSEAQLADPAMAASERAIRKCVHCGFCTATCPTYVLLGDERDSPRGRIAMIQDMLEHGRVPSAETVRHVDRCLSCLSCKTTCPSGVNYPHLIDHARAWIETHYRRPWHERLLRTVLAQALGVPPAIIVLEERAGQAPRLLSPAGAVHFSLSHSGHWIACAVSRQTALGLDIEVMNAKRDVLALARQAFGDAVANHLAAMPREQQLASFYRRWSEYEARYKLGVEAGEAASCVALAHAELSIVLCSAAPLAQRPVLCTAALAPG